MYHYYVIVDLYFHSYFQERRELKKAIPKDKRWIPCTVLAYMNLSGSVQSFKVSRTRPLKGEEVQERYFSSTFGYVSKYEKIESRMIIVFFRTFSAERGCYYVIVLTRVCKNIFIAMI